jgi:hypothetical protein
VLALNNAARQHARVYSSDIVEDSSDSSDACTTDHNLRDCTVWHT